MATKVKIKHAYKEWKEGELAMVEQFYLESGLALLNPLNQYFKKDRLVPVWCFEVIENLG